ncbi:hypothetical protein PAPYR_12460 [Paratrimastix pyriformis]|uniref:Uncharacterized protein n=1 Tax=Paratrimastix pyriformis TaxID=342808 RepID=A0ABQ8U1V8_9EUKA|nr:hypothetical protein PAPYR_12460 [Paratrimastix pyriformis]
MDDGPHATSDAQCETDVTQDMTERDLAFGYGRPGLRSETLGCAHWVFPEKVPKIGLRIASAANPFSSAQQVSPQVLPLIGCQTPRMHYVPSFEFLNNHELLYGLTTLGAAFLLLLILSWRSRNVVTVVICYVIGVLMFLHGRYYWTGSVAAVIGFFVYSGLMAARALGFVYSARSDRHDDDKDDN